MFNVTFDDSDLKSYSHPDYQKAADLIISKLQHLNLKNHYVLFSSGTTGKDLKGYVISRDALFANATAVNNFFDLSSKDVWGLSLPLYHVGGLSVLARAHLLQNKVIDMRGWNIEEWMKQVDEVTITTIVPTQLYDLVKLKKKAPASLRYLIVGGDLLNSELKSEALKLGWPVIRTFGMTEVCSQLASARSPESDLLEILPIHSVLITNDMQLSVKGPALFTLQFILKDELEIKFVTDLSDEAGFYLTSDRAQVSGHYLQHFGRLDDQFKVAGHLVNVNDLKETLHSFLVNKKLFGEIELAFETDPRKGKKLIVLYREPIPQIIFHEIQKLFSPVKVDEFRAINEFSRTELGKLKKQP